MWRRLFSGRRRPERTSQIARAADVWERAGKVATATLPVMAEVEALALKVYGDHGLPTRPGHYRRGPDDDHWTYLGEHVDAPYRWAMVLDRPPESGWRYATLEDIGRHPGGSPQLQAASGLLSTCRHLKSRLTGREPGEPGDDIETAIRLGVEWRALQDALAQPARDASRLKLTRPVDALPEPAPGPAAKPKRTRRKKAD